MNRQQVYTILSERGLKPNKRLGQNFLVDSSVCERIVSVSKTDGTVLEVGPGLGSLTEILAVRAPKLACVEIDAGYFSLLSERYSSVSHVEIIHGDILKMDTLPHFDSAVSNLPYYCASEILFRLMDHAPEKMTVMIQKEMASRISAKPGTSSYGALSLNIDVRYRVEHSFDVGKNSFYPRPDVDSTVIVFSKRRDELMPAELLPLFRQLVKTLFWGRRKTVLKCLTSSPHLRFTRQQGSDILDGAGIAYSERGENLSLDQYITLTGIIKNVDPIL